MSEEKTDRIIALLQEMQTTQQHMQALQKRQLDIAEQLHARAEEQYERAARLTSKAEALQDRGLKAVIWLVALATIAIALLAFC